MMGFDHAQWLADALAECPVEISMATDRESYTEEAHPDAGGGRVLVEVTVTITGAKMGARKLTRDDLVLMLGKDRVARLERTFSEHEATE